MGLFDNGHITLNYCGGVSGGMSIYEKYIFQKSIFVCTSNLYQKKLMEAFSCKKKTNEIADLFIKYNNKKHQIPYSNSFAPEFLNRLSVIPFGPIPRGAPFQKIIDNKLCAFFGSLKKSMGVKKVIVQEKNEFIQLIEKKYYGDGTGIRKIDDKLKQIKTILLRQKSSWRCGGKDLIFYVQNGKLFSKVLTFIESYGDYNPFERPHSLLLSTGHFFNSLQVVR